VIHPDRVKTLIQIMVCVMEEREAMAAVKGLRVRSGQRPGLSPKSRRRSESAEAIAVKVLQGQRKFTCSFLACRSVVHLNLDPKARNCTHRFPANRA
jgi:hypothetical protein